MKIRPRSAQGLPPGRVDRPACRESGMAVTRRFIVYQFIGSIGVTPHRHVAGRDPTAKALAAGGSCALCAQLPEPDWKSGRVAHKVCRPTGQADPPAANAAWLFARPRENPIRSRNNLGVRRFISAFQSHSSQNRPTSLTHAVRVYCMDGRCASVRATRKAAPSAWDGR